MNLSFKRYIRYVQPRTIMHTFAIRPGHCCCVPILITTYPWPRYTEKNNESSCLIHSHFVFKNVCIAKNIRRFYGKITGNQLPVHFPFFSFLRAPVNIFMNQAQHGSKKTCMALGHIALKPKWYFRVLLVNITLPLLNF